MIILTVNPLSDINHLSFCDIFVPNKTKITRVASVCKSDLIKDSINLLIIAIFPALSKTLDKTCHC